MKKMTYVPEEYPEDVVLLQRQLREAGYDVDLGSVHSAWQAFSDGMCAQWMGLESNAQNNVDNILPYLREIEEVE